ncbi:MAG: response regulator transcription factor [Hymenobacteraceae bacterium]|nr:response regulator transcription factor [Hymenobacteraceae bacterium]
MEMKYSCLIVDDEPMARKLLQEYVQKLPFLQLNASCASALEAMQQLQQHRVDLLFLDINMPEVSGITLLRTLSQKPKVIFTTAFSEYAVQGFELDATDYLLKPITFDRFLKAVSKATSAAAHAPVAVPVAAEQPESLFLREGSKVIRLPLHDILYIEGLKDYVSIYTRSQGKVVSLQRLKHLEEQLPPGRFIRIHNSYIIHVEQVDSLYRQKVLVGERSIPVGDTYRQRFLDFLRLRDIHL